MQLGSLLEDLTVAKAKAGIEKLVKLTPQTARVITAGGEKIVKAEEVKIGDTLRVLAGETIAVDGVITLGETSVNQAVMTGESLPVDKSVGDEVSSGTVNQFGTFEMKVTKTCENSSVQRMIQLVKSADAEKAKIVGLADRWATWIVVIALVSAVLTWIISGQIIRAVTILVVFFVFCPCSLVLATPTAIMAAIGNATKHGFLVREGDALERLAKVKRIAFDKTGTLTYGTPVVTAVKSFYDLPEKELYFLCVSAEQLSEHPLDKAIVKCYKAENDTDLLLAENFKMLAGHGVSAEVDGKYILAGNSKLFAGKNIKPSKTVSESAEEYISKGCTVIYIAIDNILIGFIALSDTLRAESRRTISGISHIGVVPVFLQAITKMLHRRLPDSSESMR